jgi:hypothetical protein
MTVKEQRFGATAHFDGVHHSAIADLELHNVIAEFIGHPNVLAIIGE